MRRAVPAVLLALAVLPACMGGEDDEAPACTSDETETETGSDGDGSEGAALAYENGHPLDWRTDDAGLLEWEDRVLDLVNAHRASLHIGPLRMVRTLRRAARGHSRHMREDVHGFFAHANPEGDSPGTRLTKNSVCWEKMAENIASGDLPPEVVVQGWLDSEGHRRNIENKHYTRTGIGLQRGPDGDYAYYWTQVFAD